MIEKVTRWVKDVIHFSRRLMKKGSDGLCIIYALFLIFSLLEGLRSPVMASEWKTASGAEEEWYSSSESNFQNDLAMRTVELQLMAIKKGDIWESWNEMTTSSFRKVTSYDTFVAMVGRVSPLKEFATARLDECSFTIDSTYLRATLCDQYGVGRAIIEYLLKPEKGEWRIDTFGARVINPERVQQHRNVRERRRPPLRRPYLENG